jgi:hypothetical protein
VATHADGINEGNARLDFFNKTVTIYYSELLATAVGEATTLFPVRYFTKTLILNRKNGITEYQKSAMVVIKSKSTRNM